MRTDGPAVACQAARDHGARRQVLAGDGEAVERGDLGRRHEVAGVSLGGGLGPEVRMGLGVVRVAMRMPERDPQRDANHGGHDQGNDGEVRDHDAGHGVSPRSSSPAAAPAGFLMFLGCPAGFCRLLAKLLRDL